MLAETRAELDDFHHASKELEAELEAELQRTEKAQQDLRVKVAKAEVERDEWKVRLDRYHMYSPSYCISPSSYLSKRPTTR
jgi:t-SNARE complex subunit (syntaxin)